MRHFGAKSIADEVWSQQLVDEVGARITLGLPVENMPDPSYARLRRIAAFFRRTLKRLDRIDSHRLSEDDRLTAAGISPH